MKTLSSNRAARKQSGARPATALSVVETEGERYVSGHLLLDMLFAPEERPTHRWLQKLMERRLVPFLKIGGKVVFKPSDVRRQLERQATAKVVAL
jgi:hypothetical protein